MTGIESDLSGLTLEQLRALADECLAQAHDELFAGHGRVIQLLIVLLELGKRGKQIAPDPLSLLDVASFRWHISASHPVAVYTAPDMKRPALRMQRPRLDTEFDVREIRGDGWLLVYRNVVDGVVKLEYWIRLADVLAG